MSASFPAHWLILREPYDHAARNVAIVEWLTAWAGRRAVLDIVDLGAGLGSTLRWLAPRLGPGQRWRLVENDPDLAARGAELCPPATYVRADLRSDLDEILSGPADLVTASALLDLVSHSWARRLVANVRARSAALLVSLSYDGSVELRPVHPVDGHVINLVNRHQRGDKGFGPALGPSAPAVLAELLQGNDGDLHRGPSPWLLTPGDTALQETLVNGWAVAAAEIAPSDAAAIRAWRQRRLDWIAAHRSVIRVGHEDVLWLPRP